MGDSDDYSPEAHASENEQNETRDEPAVEASAQPEDKLEVARRFLEDEEVKSSSREKKIEFLRAKGISEDDIQALLGQVDQPAAATAVVESKPAEATPISKSQPSTQSTTLTFDRPPVVTYPEFLTKPEETPPLITTNRLINTLYAFAGLSSLLYSTSKFVVAPMVENLTDARVDLHKTTSDKLDTIVTKLEKTVSVIPPPKPSTDAAISDTISEAEDPSEMFHRDIGTQTSIPATPAISAKADTESESKKQTDRLSKLSKSLSGLKDDLRSQSSGLHDVKTLMDVFRDELDGMTYGKTHDYTGFDIYGKLRKNEPEDEIRKARDNIRRIKGALLSTRNFPASAR